MLSCFFLSLIQSVTNVSWQHVFLNSFHKKAEKVKGVVTWAFDARAIEAIFSPYLKLVCPNTCGTTFPAMLEKTLPQLLANLCVLNHQAKLAALTHCSCALDKVISCMVFGEVISAKVSGCQISVAPAPTQFRV